MEKLQCPNVGQKEKGELLEVARLREGTFVALRSRMNKRQLLELRRRLLDATPANAAHVFEFVTTRLRGSLERIILEGDECGNPQLDRLLALTATRVFGAAVPVSTERYYVHPRDRIWHAVTSVRGCSTWLIFDGASGRGVVGFARPGVNPDTWFVPFGVDDLPSERRASA